MPGLMASSILPVRVPESILPGGRGASLVFQGSLLMAMGANPLIRAPISRRSALLLRGAELSTVLI